MASSPMPTYPIETPLPTLSSQFPTTTTTPLLELLPYIRHWFNVLGAAILTTLRAVVRFCLRNLRLPVPIFLFLFAPLFVFLHYVAAIITAPYRFGVYLAEVVHPIYVFCGVAVLTGIVLGASGRGIANLAVLVISKSQAGESGLLGKSEIKSEEDGNWRERSRSHKGKGKALYTNDNDDDKTGSSTFEEDSEEGGFGPSTTVKDED